MTPHFPITSYEKCGAIPHITTIHKGMCGMILYISYLFFRREPTE